MTSTAKLPANALAAVIAEEIRAAGPLRFSRYMELCLYHPEHGFYCRGEGGPGRHGDFFTSVSVGPVFGQLLAEYFIRQWEILGRPKPFTLIEQGAHDGHLAADILAAVAHRDPELFKILRFAIIEPIGRLEVLQRQRLDPWANRLRWVRTAEELARSPEVGVFFANELLDAFPVDRFRFDGEQWHELLIGLPEWRKFPVCDLVNHKLEACATFTWVKGCPRTGFPWISARVPEGYTTEFCSIIRPWLVSAAATLSQGAVLIIDYGREAEDYYAPHRTEGTLRGYRAHQRCDDPFSAPGETDITADVNFTEVIDAAREIGLDSRPLERQEAFLTRLARDRLREMTGPPSTPEAQQWLRQFQTLTHPGIMGSSFQVLELWKGHPGSTVC